MRAKAAVGVVVKPPDRRVLDGSVHPFNLAVRPWVIELGETMVDAELGTGEIKGVGTEGPPVLEPLLNLLDTPAALRRRELKPVIREDRVNAVGHTVNEPSKEVRRDPARGLFVELREGELANPVDRDEQIQLASSVHTSARSMWTYPSGYALNCRRGGGPSMLGRRLIPWRGKSRCNEDRVSCGIVACRA